MKLLETTSGRSVTHRSSAFGKFLCLKIPIRNKWVKNMQNAILIQDFYFFIF